MSFFLRIITIPIAVCVVFSALPAFAGSTALSESKFLVQGDPGSVISRTLTVSNLSDQPQSYSFYPDEPGELSRQRISLSPSEFQLLPRQSLDVMVRFRQGNDNWRTYLNLVAYNDGQSKSNFRVADGIKIPVNFITPQVAGITVARSNSSFWLWFWNIFIFAIDLILLSVVCFWCCRRFKKGVTLKCHSPHPNKINFL